jgi:hypothetical protein
MSLINNALKEAVETRPKNATPNIGTQFMAVDCPPRSGHSNIGLTALIAVVMMLSGVMMWKWFRADSGEMKVRARSYDSVVNPVSTPKSLPESQPKSKSPTASAKDAAVVPTSTGNEQKPETGTTTDLAVAPEPPKPEPVIYKLQGIVYQPGRSTAVINGKTVSAGERVGDSRVLKVEKDFVVLVNSAGQTNLLDLP